MLFKIVAKTLPKCHENQKMNQKFGEIPPGMSENRFLNRFLSKMAPRTPLGWFPEETAPPSKGVQMTPKWFQDGRLWPPSAAQRGPKTEKCRSKNHTKNCTEKEVKK